MSKGIWVRSEIEVNEGETLYFFHPADGGVQAHIAMSNDGTVEFRGDHRVVIEKIGSNERVILKNAADLIVS